MKILMISDVYFPRINGVSTSIATFREALEKLGHETHLRDGHRSGGRWAKDLGENPYRLLKGDLDPTTG